MEDCYKLKNKIECLIQGHLKKYIKGNSARGLGVSNSQRKDSFDNLGSKKGKETTKLGKDISIPHTLNTIAWGFSKCGIFSLAHKEQALQVQTIDASPIGSEADELESLKANITFFKKDAYEIHLYNDDPEVISIQCKS